MTHHRNERVTEEAFTNFPVKLKPPSLRCNTSWHHQYINHILAREFPGMELEYKTFGPNLEVTAVYCDSCGEEQSF